MRFPRNARVFRGQLELAPFAGVFFLLVLFFLLHSSIVFTPGIRLHLTGNEGGASGGEPRRTVTVGSDAKLHYQGGVFDEPGLLQRLREDTQSAASPGTLVIQADPVRQRELVVRLRDAARALRLGVETPGIAIQLPQAESAGGIDGPTVAVAVNLSGQLYYEDQLITESALKARLQAAVRQSREPVTLVLLADQEVQYAEVVRLAALARQAGITQALQATRPVITSASTNGLPRP